MGLMLMISDSSSLFFPEVEDGEKKKRDLSSKRNGERKTILSVRVTE